LFCTEAFHSIQPPYPPLELILKYFPHLSEQQRKQFAQLEPLYQEWNSKINLISRQDISHLYEKHVLHSLGIAKIISFNPDTSILDVGTGGGFPGIPLAILFPECHFHLVDSIGKKIKVVQEVAQALELSNVKAEQIRAEKIQNTYDFILSRAVTDLKEFYGWVRYKINKPYNNKLKNGILYLKGGDLKQELLGAKFKYRIYNLSDYFEEPFFETKRLVYVPS
jgi:16S rRNA (guanine527-N7)-methyltransferase